jgi:alpha-tubulin suppressor-like RCC1 family protein
MTVYKYSVLRGFNTGVDKSPVQDNFIPKDIFVDGGLWSWGRNTSGHLGDNTVVNTSSPVQTVAGGTVWKLCAAGAYGTGAIKSDGTLWNWGAFSGLGDNTIVNKSSPVQTISGGTDWKQIDQGFSYAAAIKTDGTLWMWGSNGYYTLGDGTTTSKSSPVQTLAGGADWKQVSAGSFHVGAVKTDGTLWTWGDGYLGGLGLGDTLSKSSPSQVGTLTTWKQVSCGAWITAAIQAPSDAEPGRLWMWGRNDYGQLGNNTRTNSSSPVQVFGNYYYWKQVNVGSNHTAAVRVDGTLWLWGYNAYGQLGNNSRSNRSSPVQTISTGTNWKQVSCGSEHTSAIKTDGTLWSWGRNNYGQLCDNTIASKSSPVQTVAGGTNWKQVDCGLYHTTAVKDDSIF